MIFEFFRNTMATICDESKLSSEGKTILTRLNFIEALSMSLLFFAGWYIRLSSLRDADQAIPNIVIMVITFLICPFVIVLLQYPIYLYCKNNWPASDDDEYENDEVEIKVNDNSSYK